MASETGLTGRRGCPGESGEEGKLPRITRLMALAIKFEVLLGEGTAADYADLARLGKVTRARMTQIMNLLNLAPDIQEEILFLPRTEAGRDIVTERDVREVTRLVGWVDQRRAWRQRVDPGRQQALSEPATEPRAITRK